MEVSQGTAPTRSSGASGSGGEGSEAAVAAGSGVVADGVVADGGFVVGDRLEMAFQRLECERSIESEVWSVLQGDCCVEVDDGGLDVVGFEGDDGAVGPGGDECRLDLEGGVEGGAGVGEVAGLEGEEAVAGRAVRGGGRRATTRPRRRERPGRCRPARGGCLPG